MKRSEEQTFHDKMRSLHLTYHQEQEVLKEWRKAKFLRDLEKLKQHDETTGDRQNSENEPTEV